MGMNLGVLVKGAEKQYKTYPAYPEAKEQMLPDVGERALGFPDPASFKLSLAEYIEAAAEFESDAKALEITDQDRLNFAVGIAGGAKKIAKGIDAKRRDYTAEAEEFIKLCKGICNQIVDRLAAGERIIKEKIGAYQTRIELDRRKQEEIARKAAIELQKKMNKEAKAAGVEAPVVPAMVIPEATGPVRSETGSTAYQVKRWICTVTDPGQVPREYCEPSKKILDDAVKMGARSIPGCEIKEITDTRIRS